MGWNIRKAQSQGIDVAQVFESWATHLTNSEAPEPVTAAPLDLAVGQSVHAEGYVWETIGDAPFGGGSPIRVSCSIADALQNKTTCRELIERRYRRCVIDRALQSGEFSQDMEGRRAATRYVMAAQLSVVDVLIKLPSIVS